MRMYDYDYTDKVFSAYRKKIIRLFSRFKSVADFDEINLLNRSTDLFDELESEAEKIFLRIGKHYAKDYDQEDIITKKWMNGYLESYNPVTTYQYKHEVDRKKYRMFEAFMATKALVEIDKCLRLWTVQVKQACDDLTDKAIVDAAKKAGYKWVMWLTEHDDKVCHECEPRDGKIYPITDIPDKPHYNCRCLVVPISESDKEDSDNISADDANKTVIFTQSITETNEVIQNKTESVIPEQLTDESGIIEQSTTDSEILDHPVNYIHGKEEWNKRYSPNQGFAVQTIYVDNEGIIRGAGEYINDVDVPNETKTPHEWYVGLELSEQLKANVILLPRVEKPDGVSMADFLINNEKYDLKTPEGNGINTIKNMLNKAKYQANCFVISLSNKTLTKEQAIESINRIYNNPAFNWVENIILIDEKQPLSGFTKSYSEYAENYLEIIDIFFRNN